MKAIKRHVATFLAALMVLSTISNTYLTARASGDESIGDASADAQGDVWTDTSDGADSSEETAPETAITSDPVDQSWDATEGAWDDLPDAQIVEVTDQPLWEDDFEEEILPDETEDPLEDDTDLVNIRGPTIKVDYDATVGGSVSPSSETADADDVPIILNGSTAVAESGYIFSKWVADDGEVVSEEARFIPDQDEINYILNNYVPDTDNEIHVTYTAEFVEVASEYEKEIPNVIKVYVQVSEGAFDSEVELVVLQLAESTQEYRDAEDALDRANRDYDGMMAFDIHFEDVETGEEIEPTGPVRVDFEILKRALDRAEGFAEGNDADADFAVLHLKEDNRGDLRVAETVADTADESEYYVDVTTDINDNATSVETSFMVDSFSIWVIVTDKPGFEKNTETGANLYSSKAPESNDYVMVNGVRYNFVERKDAYFNITNDQTMQNKWFDWDKPDVEGYRYTSVYYIKDSRNNPTKVNGWVVNYELYGEGGITISADVGDSTFYPVIVNSNTGDKNGDDFAFLTDEEVGVTAPAYRYERVRMEQNNVATFNQNLARFTVADINGAANFGYYNAKKEDVETSVKFIQSPDGRVTVELDGEEFDINGAFDGVYYDASPNKPFHTVFYKVTSFEVLDTDTRNWRVVAHLIDEDGNAVPDQIYASANDKKSSENFVFLHADAGRFPGLTTYQKDEVGVKVYMRRDRSLPTGGGLVNFAQNFHAVISEGDFLSGDEAYGSYFDPVEFKIDIGKMLIMGAKILSHQDSGVENYATPEGKSPVGPLEQQYYTAGTYVGKGAPSLEETVRFFNDIVVPCITDDEYKDTGMSAREVFHNLFGVNADGDSNYNGYVLKWEQGSLGGRIEDGHGDDYWHLDGMPIGKTYQVRLYDATINPKKDERDPINNGANYMITTDGVTGPTDWSNAKALFEEHFRRLWGINSLTTWDDNYNGTVLDADGKVHKFWITPDEKPTSDVGTDGKVTYEKQTEFFYLAQFEVNYEDAEVGSLRITKRLEGNTAQAAGKTFTFTVTGTDGSKLYFKNVGNNIYNAVAHEADGTTDTIGLIVGPDGGSVTIQGLTPGARYVVREEDPEKPDGYNVTTLYSPDGGVSPAIIKDGTVEVIVTNAYTPEGAELTVTKVFTGDADAIDGASSMKGAKDTVRFTIMYKEPGSPRYEVFELDGRKYENLTFAELGAEVTVETDTDKNTKTVRATLTFEKAPAGDYRLLESGEKGEGDVLDKIFKITTGKGEEDKTDGTIAFDHATNTMQGAALQITNEYERKLTDITVTKKWTGTNPPAGAEDKVVVNLYAGTDRTNAVRTATLTKDNLTSSGDWSYTFANLPETDNQGKRIVYTVVEVSSPAGYVFDVEESKTEAADGEAVIVNKPVVIEKSFKKIWDDENNAYGTRPQIITLGVFSDAEGAKNPVAYKVVQGGMTDAEWTVTFDNLRQYEAGKEIHYTIKELRKDGNPDNAADYVGISDYTVTTDDEKGTVTNQLNHGSITITKSITGFAVPENAPAKADEEELAREAKKWVQENIRFEVYRKQAGGTPALYKTYQGDAIRFDASGRLTITDDVPIGEYYVKEIKINTQEDFGYKLTAKVDGAVQPGTVDEVYSVTKTVAGGASVTYSFENDYVREDDLIVEPVKLEIHKVDEFGNPISAPATFTLDRGRGAQKELLRTNENGIATIDNITGSAAGDTYILTLEESDAPAGYQRTDAKWTITVSRNNPRITQREKKWTLVYGTAVQVTVEDEVVLAYDDKTNTLSFTVKNEKLRDITVEKEWKDSNNQDRLRNEETSVKVELVGTVNGKEVYSRKQTITTGTANTGAFTFTNLKVYYTDPATKVTDRTPITYAVYEIATDASGRDVRLTTGGKLRVTNADNGRAGDYDVTVSAPVTGAGTEGAPIEPATIKVTNAYKTQEVGAKVTKVWDDASDQDGVRPTEITVQLRVKGSTVPARANGNFLPNVVLTTDSARRSNGSEIVKVVGGDEWSYEWTADEWHLPKYDDAGREIEYVVYEMIKGATQENGSEFLLSKEGNEFKYTVSYNWPNAATGDVWASTVTNSHTPLETEIWVKKYWEDQEDQDGVRTQIFDDGGITLHLEKGGVAIKTATIRPSTNAFDVWETVFTGLPMYENGTKIVYTVTEDSLKDKYGYTTVYTTPQGATGTGTKDNPLPVTNSRTPGVNNVHVQKIWRDGDNRDGKRQDVEVELQMKKASEPESAWRTATKVKGSVTAVVTLKAPDYSYDWTGLDDKLNGEKLLYRVIEITDLTGKGYGRVVYSETAAGLTLTNPYTPETTSVSVVKVWEDENNVAGVRPDEITFVLYADGGVATADKVYAGESKDFNATHVIGVNDSTSYTWNNLYKYYTVDGQTREIVYSVVELDAAGNVVAQAGTNGTYNVKAKEVAGYADAHGADAEDQIATYTTKVENTTGDADKNFKITNTYHPDKVKVTATKTWVDDNRRDGLRGEVTVELVHRVGGTWTSFNPKVTKTFTVADTNSVEFTDLEQFVAGRNGEPEVYRIFELDDAGNWVKDEETLLSGTYTADYDKADDAGGFTWTVENENVPLRTKVTITKVWDDESDRDGKRPETVTFRLMDGTDTAKAADVYAGTGTFKAEITIPADGGAQNGDTWTYTWDDLYYKKNGQVIDYNVVEVSGASVFTKATNGTATFTSPAGATYLVTVGDVTEAQSDTVTSGRAYEQTITNSATPEKVTIPVKKTWDDKNDQDGRRTDLTFILYKTENGAKVEVNRVTMPASATVGANNTWEYVFTTDAAGNALYKYEGKQEIVYSVEEEGTPEGYTVARDGNHFTNSYNPGKVNVSVTKSFADDENRENKRPAFIDVQLYADGEAVGEKVTLNANNNWTKTWTDLDEKKAGQTIVYTVEELNGAGARITYTPAVTYTRDADTEGTWTGTYNTDYDVTITGTGLDSQNKSYEIVNSHTPQTTSVTVTKDWQDNINNDGKRPDSVKVKLLANGAEALFGAQFGTDAASYGDLEAVVELSEDNDWTYTWDGLFVMIDGKVADYTVVELDSADGDRQLREGDRLTDKKTADDVTPQKRYVVSYDHTGNNWTVTNTRENEKTSLTVIKHWNDLENRQGLRRDVTVELYADDEPTGIRQTITKTAYDTENDKQVVFEGLDRYANGREIVYTVYEIDADGTPIAALGELHDADGTVIYTVAYSGVTDTRDKQADTVTYEQTVTNENAPGTTTVQARKVWDDSDNQDGKRPLKVELKLVATANGRQLLPADYVVASALATFSEVITLTGDANGDYAVLTGTWENLYEKYEGADIAYTVIELGTTAENDKVTLADKDGARTYTVEIGTEDGVFVITNSHTPEKVEVRIIKKWDDDANRDGLRAPVDVELLANGVQTGVTGTLTTAQDASVKFTDLDKYHNGEEIVYTVRELSGGVVLEEGATLLDNEYTVSYADGGNVGGVFTTVATNRHIPKTTEVEVVKTWDDDANRDGVRPASIWVQLQYEDGTVVAGTEATKELNTANGYHATWEGLTAYANTAADADKEGTAEVVPVRYRVVELSSKGGDALAEGGKLQDSKRNDTYTVSYKDAEGNAYTNGLAAFKEEGDALAGYVSGITNAYEPEKVEVEVTKTWLDANNQDGKRPATLEYILSADGEQVAKVLVKVDQAHNDSSKNSGAYTFGSVLKAGTDAAGNVLTLLKTDEGSTDTLTLFKNKPEGVKINYNVTESVVESYTTVPTGEAGEYKFHFDNSYEPGKTSVTVTKNWDDDTNRDGQRQKDNVTFYVGVQLMADGVKAEVPAGQSNPAIIHGDGQSVTWSGLPEMKDGKAIVYTVVELDGNNKEIELDANGSGTFSVHYDVTLTGDQTEGYVFTNSHVPETTEVKARKVWDDAHDQDGYRPAEIRVQLFADGSPEIERVVDGKVVKEDTYILTITDFNEDGKLDASDFVTFTDLVKNAAKTDAGQATKQVIYTVVELDEKDRTVSDGESLIVTSADNRTGSYDVTVTGSQADGFTITNSLTPEEVKIRVLKHWDDEDNRDGLREDVYVGLYAGGVKIDEATLGTTEGATVTFEGLDKYANGQEIVYDVYELDGEGGDPVEGGAVLTLTNGTYEVTYEGGRRELEPGRYAYDLTKVTNTHAPALVDVSITKVWDDADDQDGFRPGSVSFMLKANGAEATREVAVGNRTAADMGYAFNAIITIEPVTVTDPDTGEVTTTWPAYTWKDLYQKYHGQDITYTVVELDSAVNNKELKEGDNLTGKNGAKDYEVAEVETAGNATTITNRHTPEETELKVVKTWNDADDNDNVRPDSVWVALYADGEPTGAQLELKKGSGANANQYEGTFTGLPKREAGKEIVYTIEELTGEDGAVVELNGALNGDGYTLTFKDAANVTNSRNVDLTEVSVTKVWEDEDDQDGKRPASVRMQLQVNGQPVSQEGISATVELSEANGWSYTWTGLIEKDGGARIAYEVVELGADGRSVKLNPQTDPDGNIYYVYDAAYTATVESVNAVQDADTGAITGENIYTWTNTHEPETTVVPVKKTWDDADNQDGIRGDLTFTLKVGDETINTTTLHVTGEEDWTQGADANEWLYIFRTDAQGNDLPKYANGEVINYTVEETGLEGYTTSIDNKYTREVDGVTYTGYAFKNSHDQEVLVVRVTKIWEDGANRDGKRPAEVTFYLKADGVTIAREDVSWKDASMNDNGDFEVTFDQVNQRADGFKVGDPLYVYRLDGEGKSTEIVYTIEEKAMDNYTAEITKEADDTTTVNGVEIARLNYTVLNPYTPGSTTVSVTKVWDDLDNRDGVRPENGAVQVQLLANGGEAIEVLEPVDPDNPDATRRVLDTYKDGWTVTLDTSDIEGGSLSYTFADLVINGSDGKEVVYTVVELDADGKQIALANGSGTYNADYAVTITGDAAEGFTVTNAHEPAVTKVTVEKVWHDADDKDEVRPAEVSFLLLADGAVADKAVVGGAEDFNSIATIKAGADGKWSHTWTDLFEKHEGETIEYTVVELKNAESAGEDNRLAQGGILPNKNGEVSHTATDKDGIEHTVIDGYDVAYSAVTGNAKDGYSITVTNTHDSKIEKEVSATEDVGTNDGKDHLDLLEGMRNKVFTYTIKAVISDRDKVTQFVITDEVVDELKIDEGSVKVVSGPEGGVVKVDGQKITVTWGDGNTELSDTLKGKEVAITFDANIREGVNLAKYVSVTTNRVEVPNDVYYDYAVDGDLDFDHDPHYSDKVTTTPPEEEPKKEVHDVKGDGGPEHIDLTDRAEVFNYVIKVTVPEKDMDTFVIEDDLEDVLIFTDAKGNDARQNIASAVTVTGEDGKEVQGVTVSIKDRDTLQANFARALFTEGDADIRGTEVTISFYARIRTTEENGGTPVDLGQYATKTDRDGNPLTGDNEFVRIPNEAYYEYSKAGFPNERKYTDTVTVTPPPPKFEKEVEADENGTTNEDNTHADLAARYGVHTYTLRTFVPEAKGLTEFTITDVLEPVLQFASYEDGSTRAGLIKLTVKVGGEEITANASITDATAEEQALKTVNAKTQKLVVSIPAAYLTDAYKGKEVVVIFNAKLRDKMLDGSTVDLKPYIGKVNDGDDAGSVNIPNDATYDAPGLDIPDDYKTTNKVTVTPPDPDPKKEVEATEGGTNNADHTHTDLIDREEVFRFTVTAYVPEKDGLEEFVINDYVAKGLEVVKDSIKVTVGGNEAQTKQAEVVDETGTTKPKNAADKGYEYEQVVRVSLDKTHLDNDQGKEVVVTFEAKIAEGADLSAYFGDTTSIDALIPNDAGYTYRRPDFPNGEGTTNRVTVTPPDPEPEKEATHLDGKADHENADGLKDLAILEAYNEQFRYVIRTRIPYKAMTAFEISDTLEPVLTFVTEATASDATKAAAAADGASGRNLVAVKIDGKVVNDMGVDVRADASLAGKNELTVKVPQKYYNGSADEARGKEIEVIFYAEVKEGADLSAYDIRITTDKTKGPQVPNKAQYTYKANVNIPNGSVTKDTNDVYVEPKPELVDIRVTKAWDDDDNRDGVRPDSITVTLTASIPEALSGLARDERTVTIKPEGGTWKEHVWVGLPKYVNGTLVKYEVTEDAVAEYKATYDEKDAVVTKNPADGQTTTLYQVEITNEHTPGRTQVSVVKIWNDVNNRDRIRPATITVRLLADGTEVERATLSAATTWSYTFDDLYTKADGKDITYTVTEDTVARYTTQITGSRYAYTITNTYTPEDPPRETPPPEDPPTPPTPPPVVPGEVLGARRTDSEAVLGARRGKTGEKSQENRLMAVLASGAMAMLLAVSGRRKKKVDGD